MPTLGVSTLGVSTLGVPALGVSGDVPSRRALPEPPRSGLGALDGGAEV